MDLNSKHKAFCDDYLITLNATESYMKVYGCNAESAKANASRLIAKANVKKYLDERMEAKEDNSIMKQDEILSILTAIARGQESEEDVSVTQAGKVIRFEKNPSNKDRMKALELLGKRYRLFTDKVEANVKATTIVFEGEEELED
ncbi:terminase small subunit [[Clostridium] bifermentans ATCC 638]|uniref:Terminase small subunit n=1 Tax=Paraclostridium bifermentans ATCC 638 = DSM 14991 TaxID=1233171 RepID=T4VF73_PARBF|nr:terminase small subunit [Paraclostridium bifermentans]EQK39765.1 terminase small subunit [[Clostridium] bifermentans ATCC 638] [Paraclostridium bifermentans ATCC 638 = DSM 14991]